jgi:hypothetical protein
MCLHRNGVGLDGGSTDNTVVLPCNHFTVRVSATTSLYRVSTQQFYLTGNFIGWDILLKAVITGITIQGTLLALLLDYRAGSVGLLSAILATQLRTIFSWYPGLYPKVLRENAGTSTENVIFDIATGLMLRIPVLRNATPCSGQFNACRRFEGT